MVEINGTGGGSGPSQNVTVTNTPGVTITGQPIDVSGLSVDVGDVTISDIEPIPGIPNTYSGTLNDGNTSDTVISGHADGTREVAIRCQDSSANPIDFQFDQTDGSWFKLNPGESYTGEIRVGQAGDNRDLIIRRNTGAGTTATYEVIATF